jgi:hypothetical protein
MRGWGFILDDPVPPRFKTKRPHVSQQFEDIDQREVADSLTRRLRPWARRALLGVA